ncbi:MAG: hypothetical protein KDD33_01945 [Bdellovibrionales bacterium]|nr:hypothetical protein [Bdellovibrionales bacterium]
MRIFFAIITLIGMSSVANASQCYIEADMSGKSWHFFVGHATLDGQGQISCYDKESNRFQPVMDVVVEAESVGFGLGLTKIDDAKLFSTGLGLIESADSLVGEYLFVKTGVQAGPIGADLGTTILFKAERGQAGLAIPFGLNLKKGAGIELSLLDVMKVKITPIDR